MSREPVCVGNVSPSEASAGPRDAQALLPGFSEGRRSWNTFMNRGDCRSWDQPAQVIHNCSAPSYNWLGESSACHRDRGMWATKAAGPQSRLCTGLLEAPPSPLPSALWAGRFGDLVN